uniref:Uncharacterized protein n=1 Tax=Setaria viridis TaxID=4556 RepID=A0A4U6VNZ4_SETVI|nr:hypothetical protein SEVIR_2G109300v2 [Setaria viridis]
MPVVVLRPPSHSLVAECTAAYLPPVAAAGQPRRAACIFLAWFDPLLSGSPTPAPRPISARRSLPAAAAGLRAPLTRWPAAPGPPPAPASSRSSRPAAAGGLGAPHPPRPAASAPPPPSSSTRRSRPGLSLPPCQRRKVPRAAPAPPRPSTPASARRSRPVARLRAPPPAFAPSRPPLSSYPRFSLALVRTLSARSPSSLPPSALFFPRSPFSLCSSSPAPPPLRRPSVGAPGSESSAVVLLPPPLRHP